MPQESSRVAQRPGRAREAAIAFAVLVGLTLCELAVARTAGIGRGAARAALVALALSKAGLIALVFMHLRRESRGLRLAVLLPLLLPALYAVAIVADALRGGVR